MAVMPEMNEARLKEIEYQYIGDFHPVVKELATALRQAWRDLEFFRANTDDYFRMMTEAQAEVKRLNGLIRNGYGETPADQGLTLVSETEYERLRQVRDATEQYCSSHSPCMSGDGTPCAEDSTMRLALAACKQETSHA
jgi:hypothetical protein